MYALAEEPEQIGECVRGVSDQFRPSVIGVHGTAVIALQL